MKENNAVLSKILKICIYALLFTWAFTTIFPFVWVFLNSFKESNEVLSSSFSLPKDPSLDNFFNAFSKQNILRSYLNSFIISGSVTFFVLIFGAMASFVMVRYTFKAKKVINTLFIGSLMFPAFATIIPVFALVAKFNAINTYQSVIVPQIAGNLSFAIIVLMGFMRSLSIELEEAAFIEGASTMQIFTRIILPLSRPSLASVAIFTFLWSYNDLFLQLTMLRRREMYPVSTLLNEISSQFGTDFGLMCAAVVLVVLPVMIVYMFLQNNIIKGMSAGALKG